VAGAKGIVLRRLLGVAASNLSDALPLLRRTMERRRS
jgi:hypothetical protein